MSTMPRNLTVGPVLFLDQFFLFLLEFSRVLELQLHEFGLCLVARPWQPNRYDFMDATRPTGHQQYAVGKLDGLFNVVGYEEHGFRLAPPDPQQFILHEEPVLVVEG